MSPLRKYILYSTILGLFSGAYMLNAGPVHLLYFYALLLINLSILAIEGALWMPGRLIGFLSYITISGVVALVFGTGSVPGLAKDLVGIVPSALYFAAFFRYMRFNVRECFALYALWAFYVAAFGIVYLPFQPWGGGRLMSICLEPSAFCLICVPAAFYYLDQWQRERRGGMRLIVLLIALALTGSSLGYLGLLLGLYFFGRRYRFGKTLAPALVVLLGAALFNYSELFRIRMTDAIVGSTEGTVAEANISTFGILANYYVTREIFLTNPVTGGGFGSYFTSHERFLGSIPGIETVLDADRLGLGQWDASSLFLRLTAELGLVGLCAVAWFLYTYYPRRGSPEERAVAMSVLCYLFMKLLRDGSYFNPEVFFFFGAHTVLGAVARMRSSPPTAVISSKAALAAPNLALPQES